MTKKSVVMGEQFHVSKQLFLRTFSFPPFGSMVQRMQCVLGAALLHSNCVKTFVANIFLSQSNFALCEATIILQISIRLLFTLSITPKWTAVWIAFFLRISTKYSISFFFLGYSWRTCWKVFFGGEKITKKWKPHNYSTFLFSLVNF